MSADAPPPEAEAPVALVTGAARGIGAAIARDLAAHGWRVALVDVCADHDHLPYALATRADLDAAAAACGPDALAIVADVRHQASIDTAVDTAVTHFGQLDAVVAAAGAIAGGEPVWRTHDDTWQTMLDLNLTGVFRLVRAAVPHLLERPQPRHGRVVVVASAASLDGLPMLGAYTAAKHGVAGLVKALAVELAPEGITANAVCPGSTRTAMLDASAAVYQLDSAESFAAQQPVGRLLEPAEIAAAVTWLCSRGASGLSGAIVPVDGAMTAN